MPTIKSFLDDRKTYGTVKATVIDVKVRTPKGYTIFDLELNDGTGTITLSVFNPTISFKVGDVIQATQCYQKEFKGAISLNQKKEDSTIAVVGQANALDATIDSAKESKTVKEEPKKETKIEPKTPESTVARPIDLDVSGLTDAMNSMARSIANLTEALPKSMENLIMKIAEFQVSILRHFEETINFHSRGITSESREEDQSEEPPE